jgi:hypothetical protein
MTRANRRVVGVSKISVPVLLEAWKPQSCVVGVNVQGGETNTRPAIGFNSAIIAGEAIFPRSGSAYTTPIESWKDLRIWFRKGGVLRYQHEQSNIG